LLRKIFYALLQKSIWQLHIMKKKHNMQPARITTACHTALRRGIQKSIVRFGLAKLSAFRINCGMTGETPSTINQKPSTAQSAFTLIELAIVIVIIGALLVGVLQGQELISQAKNHSQIKQIEEYNVATLAFKSKYDYLPNDVPSANATVFGLYPGQGTRTGNGVMDDSSGNIPNTSAWSEGNYFFPNLSLKQFIKDYLRPQTNDFSVGTIFPEAKLGVGGIAPVGLSDGMYWFLGPTRKNDTTNNAGYIYLSEVPSLSPEQASAIDGKIDDGIPSQGFVRAVIVTASVSTNFSNDTTLNSCLGATNQGYNLTNSNILCRLVIKSKVY
jgi:prepilin-type N-terminal cleavage/methylation domain-containing protein